MTAEMGSEVGPTEYRLYSQDFYVAKGRGKKGRIVPRLAA
jgi:hypothetical protein